MFHPRYWPTWLALGILRLFEPLPFPLLVWLGRRLGDLRMAVGMHLAGGDCEVHAFKDFALLDPRMEVADFEH